MHKMFFLFYSSDLLEMIYVIWISSILRTSDVAVDFKGIAVPWWVPILVSRFLHQKTDVTFYMAKNNVTFCYSPKKCHVLFLP
jgi:hypothetical protein